MGTQAKRVDVLQHLMSYPIAENRPTGYLRTPQMADASGGSFAYDDDGLLMRQPLGGAILELQSHVALMVSDR